MLLKGNKVIGGIAEGKVIASKLPLMGCGNIDEKRGVKKNDPFHSVPFQGKVIVFPKLKGSGEFIIYCMMRYFRNNPVAFIYRKSFALTVWP